MKRLHWTRRKLLRCRVKGRKYIVICIAQLPFESVSCTISQPYPYISRVYGVESHLSAVTMVVVVATRCMTKLVTMNIRRSEKSKHGDQKGKTWDCQLVGPEHQPPSHHHTTTHEGKLSRKLSCC
ncbi:hypothetical protein BJX62DRAFT_55998 [Aspergillus germanicus]